MLEPKSHSGQVTTLADCDVEVHRYDTENRRQYRNDWEARLRWEAAQERSTQVYAMRRNVFTACGIQVPLNYGDEADLVDIALRGYQAAQEGIQKLKVRNLEGRAGA